MPMTEEQKENVLKSADKCGTTMDMIAELLHARDHTIMDCISMMELLKGDYVRMFNEANEDDN